MPHPDSLTLPSLITYRSNIVYSSNEGFVEKLIPDGFVPPDDPDDPAHIPGRYRVDRITLTDPANPTTYSFTVVSDPTPPVEITKTLYLGVPKVPEDPDAPYYDDDPAWFNLFDDIDIIMACAFAGIDPGNTVIISKTDTLTFPGELRIEGVGLAAKVIGVRVGPVLPSPVLVIISAANDSTKAVTVRFNITTPRPVTPPPWYVGMASASAPIVGFEVPVIEIPGILLAAASAGITPNNAVFESADASIMSIDSKGVATPRKAGKVNVTVKERNGNKSARVTVEVKARGSAAAPSPAPTPAPATTPTPAPTPAPAPAPTVLTAVSLRSAASVATGGTVKLEPFVTPYNADKAALKWSSSNEDIATVSGGIVAGVKAGSVKIAVTGADGAIRAECTVTVKADGRPVRSISMNPKAVNLNAGATKTPAVSYAPSNATIKGVNWSSNNSSVARVEPNGKIVAVSAGTAVITATSDSGARMASCTVTVKVPVTSVTLPQTSITIKIGETYQLVPTVNPADATEQAVKFTARSAAVATVTPAGLVTGRKAGTTTIIVAVGGKSVNCTVKVVK